MNEYKYNRSLSPLHIYPVVNRKFSAFTMTSSGGGSSCLSPSPPPPLSLLGVSAGGGGADARDRSVVLALLESHNKCTLEDAFIQHLTRPLPRWFVEVLLPNIELRVIRTADDVCTYGGRGRSTPLFGQVFLACSHCTCSVFPQKVDGCFRGALRLISHLVGCSLADDEREMLQAARGRGRRDLPGMEDIFTEFLETFLEDSQSTIGPLVVVRPRSFSFGLPQPTNGRLVRNVLIPRIDPDNPNSTFGINIKNTPTGRTVVTQDYPTPALVGRLGSVIHLGMIRRDDIVVAVNNSVVYDVEKEKALVLFRNVVNKMKSTKEGQSLKVDLLRLGRVDSATNSTPAQTTNRTRTIARTRRVLGVAVDPALLGQQDENDGGKGGNCGNSRTLTDDELAAMEVNLEELRSSAATAKADLTECKNKILQAHGALGTELEEEWKDVSTDLTQERRDAFHERVLQMDQEVSLRTATMVSLLKDCQHLIRELRVDPAQSHLDRQIMGSLARDAVTDEIVMTSTDESDDCTGINARALADLTERVAELNGEKLRRKARLGEMGAEIATLWEKLHVPESEQRAFAESVKGLGMDNIQKGRDELRRLLDLKANTSAPGGSGGMRSPQISLSASGPMGAPSMMAAAAGSSVKSSSRVSTDRTSSGASSSATPAKTEDVRSFSLINSFTVEKIEKHISSLNRMPQFLSAQLKSKCLDVLKTLMQHEHGWVFNRPVDPVKLGLPDYLDIIKKPMDFGTIKKKLDRDDNGQYLCLDDFCADVHLTLDNATLYNEEGSDVHSMAKGLKDVFVVEHKKMLADLKKEEEDDCVCGLCGEGQLLLKKQVYTCDGCGRRIGRNRNYYVGGDDQYHWCHGCFGSLKESSPIELPDMTIRKSHLLEKKNDEVNEESWVQCDRCEQWVHQICALSNIKQNTDQGSEYICPICTMDEMKKNGGMEASFTTPMAEDLPRTKLSEYLETHVRKRVDKCLERAAKEKADAEHISLDQAKKEIGIGLGDHITVRQVTSMDRKLELQERMKKRGRGRRDLPGMEDIFTEFLETFLEDSQSTIGPLVVVRPRSFSFGLPQPTNGRLVRNVLIPRIDPDNPNSTFGINIKNTPTGRTVVTQDYPMPALVGRLGSVIHLGMIRRDDIVVAVNNSVVYDVEKEKALVLFRNVVNKMKSTKEGQSLKVDLLRLGRVDSATNSTPAQTTNRTRTIARTRRVLGVAVDPALLGQQDENDGGNGGNCGNSRTLTDDELAAMEVTLEELRSSAATAKADLTECKNKILQAHGALGTELEEEWKDVSTDLTQERRDAFHERVLQMDQEVSLRTATMVSLLKDCQHLIRELRVDPAQSHLDRQIMGSLARDAVTDEIVMTSTDESDDCTGINARALADLTERVAELNGEKLRRKARLGEMGAEIATLWEKLHVPESEQRAFAESVKGLGMDNIQKGRDELRRLLDLKANTSAPGGSGGMRSPQISVSASGPMGAPSMMAAAAGSSVKSSSRVSTDRTSSGASSSATPAKTEDVRSFSLINSFTVEKIEKHISSLNRMPQFLSAQLKSKCLDVLKTLMQHEHGWVFNRPVDPVKLGLPDYLDIIKKPMDFGTIKKKLDRDDNGQYLCLDDFCADVHLTLDNATLYNEEGSDVHSMAKGLKDVFVVEHKKMLADLKKEEEDDCVCGLCGEGQLLLKKQVYTCDGCGRRIGRNRNYYVGGDDQYHWCHGCFGSLKESSPIELPDMTIRKSHLLEKKNDEVNEESWVQCDRCEQWVHQICALSNIKQNTDQGSEYICPICTMDEMKKNGGMEASFTTPMAEDLPRTKLSEYLETHVRKRVDKCLQRAAKEKADAEHISLDQAKKEIGIGLGDHITVRQVTSMDRKLELQERMKKRGRGRRDLPGMEDIFTEFLETFLEDSQSTIGPLVVVRPRSFSFGLPQPTNGRLVRNVLIPRIDPDNPNSTFGINIKNTPTGRTVVTQDYPMPALVGRLGSVIHLGMIRRDDIVVAVNNSVVYDVEKEKALVLFRNVVNKMKSTKEGQSLKVDLLRLGRVDSATNSTPAQTTNRTRTIARTRRVLGVAVDPALLGQQDENDGGNGGNCGNSRTLTDDELAAMEVTLEELRSSAATAKADLTECKNKILQAHGALGTELEEEWKDVSTDLTQERRDAFHERVLQMDQEVSLRTATMVSLLKDCQHLIRELRVDPAQSHLDRQIMGSLARDAVTDEIVMTSTDESDDCTGINARALADLTERVAELNGEKLRRKARLGEMGAEIATLWEKLHVPESEQRAFAESVKGLGMDNIQKGRDELRRLLDLKANTSAPGGSGGMRSPQISVSASGPMGAPSMMAAAAGSSVKSSSRVSTDRTSSGASSSATPAKTEDVRSFSLINSFTVEKIEKHISSLNRMPQFLSAQLKSKCLDVLKTLMQHEHGWVFNRPVDPVKLGLPDYLDIIKKPMDFGTIKKKLDRDDNGQYLCLDDFCADVHLTLDNATLYNEEGSDVHSMAKGLKDVFVVEHKKMLADLKKEEEDDCVCGLCGEGQLLLKKQVYTCDGCGRRIGRNRNYYVGGDDQYHWCHGCFGSLKESSPIELPDMTIRKSHLLEKKNDEVNEESWVQCDRCEQWVHQICALSNIKQNTDQGSEYICPICTMDEMKKNGGMEASFTTPMAEDLPRTKLSEYLETHVRKRVDKCLQRAAKEKADAEHISLDQAKKEIGIGLGDHITVRQVTSMDRKLEVQERMKKRYGFKAYPDSFTFRSKCIVVFQNLDGIDTMLFCLYVHEHDEKNPAPNAGTVYLSYLDSVNYMRPREMRTSIYHEILVAYFDYVRKRGFSKAYIWACPPLKASDDYILYAKPEDQKTPSDDRLRQWYVDMLVECQKRGICGKVANMYDLYFADTKNDATIVPYMEGDYFQAKVETIIKELEDGKAKKDKKPGNRRSARSAGYDEEGANHKCLEEGGSDFVMAKLGKKIYPMKESFLIAHLYCEGIEEENAVVPKAIAEFREKHRITVGPGGPAAEADYTAAAADDKAKVTAGVIDDDVEELSRTVMDTREKFLDFCRDNDLQFDQLRRAKHTSTMILWNLLNGSHKSSN